MSNDKINDEAGNGTNRTYVHKSQNKNVSRETIYKKNHEKRKPLNDGKEENRVELLNKAEAHKDEKKKDVEISERLVKKERKSHSGSKKAEVFTKEKSVGEGKGIIKTANYDKVAVREKNDDGRQATENRAKTDFFPETKKKKEENTAKSRTRSKTKKKKVDPKDIENPGFSEFYKSFRDNGLSVHESLYNAAYLRASDNYYSSEVSVKKKYENVYMHPTSWFNNRTSMWKHNKWSVAVKILEVPSIIKKWIDRLGRGIFRLGVGFVKAVESNSVKSSVSGLVSLILVGGTVVLGVMMWTDWTENGKCLPMLKLYVDGEYVGNVKSMEAVEKARRDVESSVSVSLGLPYTLDCSLVLSSVRTDGGDVLSDAKLGKIFHEVAHEDMFTGYCLYNGDVPICAMESKETLEGCIEESIKKRHPEFLIDEDVQNIAYKNFVVRRGSYPDTLFVDEEKLREILSVTDMEGEDKNTAKALSVEGTLIGNSATTVGVSGDAYNSSANERTELFFMNLETVVTKNETANEILPYKTEYIYDENYPEGYTSTVTYGKNGRRKATYFVEYTGGKETSRRLVDEEIVTEAVNEVKRIGKRPLTEEEKQYKSTGTYIYPAKGSLSDGYGWRIINGGNEFHRGLDIRSNGGLDVIASDGGEIIQASDIGNGYGLCVLIQHDDGTLTRYAHCDELFVTENQKVKQGQLIGKMGSTGYVTGVHLHFEIIKNGSAEDPMKYLSK